MADHIEATFAEDHELTITRKLWRAPDEIIRACEAEPSIKSPVGLNTWQALFAFQRETLWFEL